MSQTQLQTLSSSAELHEALDHALNCVLCFCGNHKRIDNPFCFQCFDSLPREWQLQMVYSPIRHLDSFQSNTYDAACSWLRAHYPHRFAV